MGDRGNIVIETADRKPLMYFYTHWTGSELPRLVALALTKGRSRWGDDAYLNRVLFQTMLEEDKGMVGYGLSTAMGDGGTEVYVCHDESRVRYKDKSYTFEEFANRKG